MKKLIVACLILCQACAQKGCTDHQKLAAHKGPFIVVSKPPPYTQGNNVYITLRDKNGEMFTLDEWDVASGMCNRYAIGDTIK